MTKRNKTLEEILDVIFYNNPSTQDEIAEELGISRRYVTKLLKPLIDQDIVKRAYILDMDKLEETYGSMNGSFNSKEHSANFLIQNMIKNMAKHVGKQVELSFEAVLENDKQIAEDALEMDFTTNNMFEKVRSSVETVVNINPRSKLSKILLFNEAAYNYERIGDYCGHIAKFVINDIYEVDEKVLKNLKKMYKTAQSMISLSMTAFIEAKTELKDDLMELEDSIHILQAKSINLIATQMAESSFDEKERSNYFIYLFRVIKAFERMGDISVEIMDLAAEFHKEVRQNHAVFQIGGFLTVEVQQRFGTEDVVIRRGGKTGNGSQLFGGGVGIFCAPLLPQIFRNLRISGHNGNQFRVFSQQQTGDGTTVCNTAGTDDAETKLFHGKSPLTLHLCHYNMKAWFVP